VNAGMVINSEGSFRLVQSQDTFLKFKGPAKSLFGLLVPTHTHLHVGNIARRITSSCPQTEFTQ
jgi:hypothetical protein